MSTYRRNTDLRIRQFGFQEAENIQLLSTITIYSASVTENNYLLILRQITELLSSNKTGPIHIEFPDDIQRLEVDMDERTISQIAMKHPVKYLDPPETFYSKNDWKMVYQLLEKSKHPVFLFGAGINNLDKIELERLIHCIDKYPVLSTWAAIYMCKKFKNYKGTIGTYGNAYGNIYLGQSDLVIAVGARLSNNIIGSNSQEFCPNAKVVYIDNCLAELYKPSLNSIKSLVRIYSDIYCLSRIFNGSSKNISYNWEPILTPHHKQILKQPACSYPVTSSYLEKLFLRTPNEIPISVDTGLTLAWSANIISQIKRLTSPFYSA